MVKNPRAGARDLGSIPGSGRSPGGGSGNPLQCSCLENSHGQRSLVDYSPWDHNESGMTEGLSTPMNLESTESFCSTRLRMRNYRQDSCCCGTQVLVRDRAWGSIKQGHFRIQRCHRARWYSLCTNSSNTLTEGCPPSCALTVYGTGWGSPTQFRQFKIVSEKNKKNKIK